MRLGSRDSLYSGCVGTSEATLRVRRARRRGL